MIEFPRPSLRMPDPHLFMSPEANLPSLLRRLTVLAGALLVPAALVGNLSPTSRFTLRELERAPELTPKAFADLFANFRFEGSPVIRPPEQFLGERRGDCDDYTVLADLVLAKHGYRTRCIQVKFAGDNVGHAVCYVSENKAYLDYNNRRYFVNLERSGQTIRQIAKKIAASFELDWTTAAEFTYSYETMRKTLAFVVVKTDPPDKDPDRGRYE
jgi:hypothetical protein